MSTNSSEIVTGTDISSNSPPGAGRAKSDEEELGSGLRSFIDDVGVAAVSRVARVPDVLHATAKTVAHRLHHKYCSIQLYDPGTTRSKVEGYYGFPASHIFETNRLLEECWNNWGTMRERAITLTAVADRQTVAVEDILHSDQFPHARELATLMDYSSVIATPLVLGSECIGVLWCCDDSRTYDMADRWRLEIAAKNIALIVELLRNGERLQSSRALPPMASSASGHVLDRFVSRFMSVVQLKNLAIQPNRLDQLLAEASAAVGFSIVYSPVPPTDVVGVPSADVDNIVEIALADECYGFLLTPAAHQVPDFNEFVGNRLLLQLVASYCAFQRRTQLGFSESSESYASYLLRGMLGLAPLSPEERRIARLRLAIGMADYVLLISAAAPDGTFATRARDVITMLSKRRVVTSGHCVTTDNGLQIVVLASPRPLEKGEIIGIVRRLGYSTGVEGGTDRTAASFCVSRSCVGLDGLAERARELEMCRRLGLDNASTPEAVFVDDYPILHMVAGVIDDQSFITRVERTLHELMKPENVELERTLRMYFASDLGKTRAAQKLFIHINTLKYRLKRVEELTGLCLSRVPDLVQMQMFLFVHDLRPGPLGSSADLGVRRNGQ
jgi:hypothetical protein